MNDKPLSKDEILTKYFMKWDYKTVTPAKYNGWIADAMDEYAEQCVRIAVEKYLKISLDVYARQENIELMNWVFDSLVEVFLDLGDGGVYYSPNNATELYEKYLESKTREKEK